MIDFRYHLVSIVAVFLALAVGIVLGATALQGGTIDGLRALNDSLRNQLNAVTAERDSLQRTANADESFLQLAQGKLLSRMLSGQKLVLVAEPGAPSSVVSGLQKAAAEAGATVTGTISLQPKFNDLSGATRASLSAINTQLASSAGIVLGTASDAQTADQQDAAQLIASSVLELSPAESGLVPSDPQSVLQSYAAGGYLSYDGNPAARATLAVIVTARATASDGPGNWSDEVLLALAGEFASASVATLVAGPLMSSSLSSSPVTVLRGSSLSGQVSSVDDADTRIGQISVIWALAGQVQGGKPNSYGVSSGASAVSPVPSPVPSASPTVTTTPSAHKTGKAKKTVTAK